MTIQVTIGKWYAVSGAAGATVTTPDGSITLCTIPDGGQGYFNAPTTSVETSDDTVKVTQATFNYAPAEMLGLLGGGVSELPKGYIRAEFLENNGQQYIATEIIPNNETGIKIDSAFSAELDRLPCGSRTTNSTLTYFTAVTPPIYAVAGIYVNAYGWGGWKKFPQTQTSSSYREVTTLNWLNDRRAVCMAGYFDLPTLPFEPQCPLYVFALNLNNTPYKIFHGKIWSVAVSKNERVAHDFIPSVNSSGEPCMYDKVSKHSFTNDGTGQFIVGFTLPQARQLSKLPDGGGALTISLPSNWQDDAAVVDALATAEGKGWVLTIQTYEAEAGAASTFVLRRIWVRKRPEQNGSYVATDGTRWQVEWCATMVGGDPQEHGYEPFRSVEAAAAYWELQPYVYPEDEQLLTD